jgi:hypothetical protein|tara:strand:+ start:1085 stop:1591 length:507 start_codon:yes stop_codon:yes gene_type:complete
MSQINVNTIALANGTEQARLVQVVNVMDGAVATGTTQMPRDNTIPQNTEGDQYMSLAITPTNTDNHLKIDVVFNYSSTSTVYQTVALFQDSVASAIAAVNFGYAPTGSNCFLTFTHFIKGSLGTAEITFKVRSGPEVTSQTTTFNGLSGTRQFGGVMASSITISEIRV